MSIYAGRISNFEEKSLLNKFEISHDTFNLRTDKYSINNMINYYLKICCPCYDQSINNVHILKEFETNKDNILFKKLKYL